MFIALMLITSSCSTYTNVYSDYDKSADFTKYKTFAWLPDKADTANTPYNNEIIRNNIRNYYGQCMSDRGFSFNADTPDILMELVVTNTKKERVITTTPSSFYYRPYYFGSSYYNPYPSNYYYRNYSTYGGYNYGGHNYGSYLGGYNTGGGYASSQKVAYVDGAITLNFIDKKTNKLVWTGTAEGDIYDPSVISRDLHPAVHSIVEQYPVKPLVKSSHKIR